MLRKHQEKSFITPSGLQSLKSGGGGGGGGRAWESLSEFVKK